ncbi:MAG TPA: hypothetical protein VIL90_04745 [Puia sp.]
MPTKYPKVKIGMLRSMGFLGGLFVLSTAWMQLRPPMKMPFAPVWFIELIPWAPGMF